MIMRAKAVSSVIILQHSARSIGRVLDDGTTQLYTYAYNPFGHLTNSIDPLGRTFSYSTTPTALTCWKSAKPAPGTMSCSQRRPTTPSISR